MKTPFKSSREVTWLFKFSKDNKWIGNELSSHFSKVKICLRNVGVNLMCHAYYGASGVGSDWHRGTGKRHLSYLCCCWKKDDKKRCPVLPKKLDYDLWPGFKSALLQACYMMLSKPLSLSELLLSICDMTIITLPYFRGVLWNTL